MNERKLSGYWHRLTRDNGESFWALTNDAPEWLQDAVREAHQGDLPDDWVYEECRAACDAIDDGSMGEDGASEHADSRTDVYTRDLYQWAADHCLGNVYSEAESEAVGSYGVEGSVVDRLQRVQYEAIYRIASTILDAWRTASEGEE